MDRINGCSIYGYTIALCYTKQYVPDTTGRYDVCRCRYDNLQITINHYHVLSSMMMDKSDVLFYELLDNLTGSTDEMS